MFCLQCGTAVTAKPNGQDSGPELEQTVDPLLQKAIVDAVKHPIHFKLPVSGAPPSKVVTSFSSMRAILSPQRVGVSGHSAAIIPAMPPVPAEPKAEHLVRPNSGVIIWAKGIEWHAIPKVWLAGLFTFALFLVLNIALQSYYSSRVYPGVRMASSNLGSISLSALHAQVSRIKPISTLSAVVGSETYQFNTSNLGTVNEAQAAREVWAAGRSTPLPIAGVLETLLSKPIALPRQLSNVAVSSLADNLVSRVDRSASNAVPIIDQGQAFVISEKSGSQLDPQRVASEIRLTYGYGPSFSMTPDKVEPAVTSSAYANDLQIAQQILAQTFQLRMGNVVYSPTAVQVGSWIAFGGPGKGVSVNGLAVANYINSIVGKFDRAAATNALVNALQLHQSLKYAIITGKSTPVPKLSSNAPTFPVATFSYCLDASSTAEAKVLSSSASNAFSDLAGWNLGGRLKFVQVSSNCNFGIDLMPASSMSSVSTACAGQTTCGVGSTLALNLSNWLAAPAAWIGGIDSYREQMISHEVGHWLGFSHASCFAKSSPVPILEDPTVELDGCSPDWYAIPVGVQGTKVFPGF